MVLATTYCNPTAICYCGNKQDAQNTNTKEIKFLSAKSHDFGKEMDSISVELSNSNTFIQSLLKLGSFLHGKTIESLNNPTNYPPINLVVTPALAPWKTTVEIEEHKKIQHLIKIIILSTIGKALHKTLKSMKLLMI
nr:hypothetical protein [Helicobacter pylori]